MVPSSWRKQRELSLRAVAQLLGVESPSSVLRYERGEREAPNSIALAYERISAGAVTSEDLARAHRAFHGKPTSKRSRAA
jgi:transcriptional regulator with XRE-family HTH domain